MEGVDYLCGKKRGADQVPKVTCHSGAEKADYHQMSRIKRKPAVCIYENKGTDQLVGKLAADQGFCFRYIDGTIHLSKAQPSLALKHNLCQTCSWS